MVLNDAKLVLMMTVRIVQRLRGVCVNVTQRNNMPKNCSNCEKYPMCRLQTNIRRCIEDEGIIDNSYFVFISLASHCRYYKEVIDE